MTPFLDLRHIAIDPTLVLHLPPGLASYYEALPVAREGNSVTVAMSHPENVTALTVLTQLLHAEIVPIRTDGASVRAALEQIYARKSAEPQGVLAWLPESTHTAWQKLLAQNGFLASTPQFRGAFSHPADPLLMSPFPITWLDSEKVDTHALLAAAIGHNYQLTLCALPSQMHHSPKEITEIQNVLLREIHTPLWLVPTQPHLPQQILLVLRGFASDEVALTWVMKLAQQHDAPTVSLLPIMGQAPWGALSYLQQGGLVQSHIADCALRLEQAGIHPTLTLQSGEPRQQVAQAIRSGDYDLMIVAAEGHGQFVGQLLVDMEEKCTWPLGGVLVLKPSHDHTQRRTER